MADSTTVTLGSLRDIERLWPEVGRRIESGVRTASIAAATYGVARGARAAQASGINATQTYARSFLALKLRDGAVLTNKAEHAYFVEAGRRPGKAPPLSVIGQWMVLKRIVKMPPKARTSALLNKRGQANRTRASKRRADKMERYRAIAWRIAMKIKHRGTVGRYIMRDMLPAVGSRFSREIRRQLSRLTRDPPR
jgi:hypothetical protein